MMCDESGNSSANIIINNDEASVKSSSKRRVSEYIIRVPLDRFNRIRATDEVNSLSRETQSFVGIATIHGLLRIYRGHGIFRLLWILVTLLFLLFFIYQLAVLIREYHKSPTASQVSFIIPENGMPFPAITVCKYNSIRQQFIADLNETVNGELTFDLLQYLALSFLEVKQIVSVSDDFSLKNGENVLRNFTKYFPNFPVESFFKTAGPLCNETLLHCSVSGKEFECCKYVTPILTDMGLCYKLELSKTTLKNLKFQQNPGASNGLQIIGDSGIDNPDDANITSFLKLIDELKINSRMDATGLFSQNFNHGFRYFIQAEYASLATEGITVSPGTRAYSGISPIRYLLLSEENGGNCKTKWPTNFQNVSSSTYSAVNCKSHCRAKFYFDLCGCSPFVFNIKKEFPVCSAYQMFKCVETYFNQTRNSSELIAPSPTCLECKLECDRWVHHTYNSYGEGFSKGAIEWLERKNPGISKNYIKDNFVTINVFYRDMSYTQYEQMQSVTFTEIMSNIGGSMGITLGMSFFSIVEIIVYLCKASWILMSKKRREYLIEKKHAEKEREKTLEETLEKAQQESRSKNAFRRIANSIRRKISKPWSKSNFPSENSESSFTSQLVEAKLRGDGKANIGRNVNFAEIKLDATHINFLRSLSCPCSNPVEVERGVSASPATTLSNISEKSFFGDSFDVEKLDYGKNK